MPFPAVSIKAGKRYDGRRLLQFVLDSLKFDCFDELFPRGRLACLEETRPVREAFGPFIAKAVEAKFVEAKAILERKSQKQKEKEVPAAQDASMFLCTDWSEYYRYNWDFANILSTFNGTEDDEAFSAKEKSFVAAFARTFRMPKDATFQELRKHYQVGGGSGAKSFEVRNVDVCLDQLGRLRPEARISAAALVALLGSGPPISLGYLLAGPLQHMRKSFIRDVPQSAALEGIKAFMAEFSNTEGKTLADLNMTYHFIVDFLTLGYPRIPERSGGPCCSEESLLLNPGLVERLMKYTYLPASTAILGRSELQDLNMTTAHLTYNQVDQLRNVNAALVGCRYPGPRRSFFSCSRFYTTYSNEGLGYTFNQDLFWNMFKKSDASKASFEAFQDREETKEAPQKIKGYGMGFSLETYVWFDPNAEVDQNVVVPDMLAIHSPFEVADFSSTGIQLKPGNTYTLLIQPSIIEMDDSALGLNLEKRGCLSRNDGHNLTAFKHYTRSACLLECHLSIAVSECNCTVWDHLVINGKVPLCDYFQEVICFNEAMARSLDKDQCSCPSNCQDILYEKSIIVEKDTSDMFENFGANFFPDTR